MIKFLFTGACAVVGAPTVAATRHRPSPSGDHKARNGGELTSDHQPVVCLDQGVEVGLLIAGQGVRSR